MNVKAYVIHLQRARCRQTLVRALLRAIPTHTVVLPAVDGKTLSEEYVRDVYQSALHCPPYPFDLLSAEVGCFLSHRRAWQSILEDDCDAGLIVEDDVAVSSTMFKETVRAAMASVRPDEFIRFPIKPRQECGAVTRAVGGLTLIEPHLPGLGMQLQLVGREAARQLLDASARFDRPVDSFVQMQWLHGVRVLSARPVVVRDATEMHDGSTVQTHRKDIIDRLSREVYRPIFRLSIRIRNDIWRRQVA